MMLQRECSFKQTLSGCLTMHTLSMKNYCHCSHLRDVSFEDAYHDCTFKYRGNFALTDIYGFVQNQDCLDIKGRRYFEKLE